MARFWHGSVPVQRDGLSHTCQKPAALLWRLRPGTHAITFPIIVITFLALWLTAVQRRFVFIAFLYVTMILLFLTAPHIQQAFAYVQLAGLVLICAYVLEFRHKPWFPALCALIISCQIFAVLPLRLNSTPFQRSLEIPYASLLASIDASAVGKSSLVTNDGVLAWEAARRFAGRLCVSRCSGKSLNV